MEPGTVSFSAWMIWLDARVPDMTQESGEVLSRDPDTFTPNGIPAYRCPTCCWLVMPYPGWDADPDWLPNRAPPDTGQQ